jgi:hypothetical protein
MFVNMGTQQLGNFIDQRMVKVPSMTNWVENLKQG